MTSIRSPLTRCAATGLIRGVPSARMVPARTKPKHSISARLCAASSDAAASKPAQYGDPIGQPSSSRAARRHRGSISGHLHPAHGKRHPPKANCPPVPSSSHLHLVHLGRAITSAACADGLGQRCAGSACCALRRAGGASRLHPFGVPRRAPLCSHVLKLVAMMRSSCTSRAWGEASHTMGGPITAGSITASCAGRSCAAGHRAGRAAPRRRGPGAGVSPASPALTLAGPQSAGGSGGRIARLRALLRPEFPADAGWDAENGVFARRGRICCSGCASPLSLTARPGFARRARTCARSAPGGSG